ncbi:MAG: CoB--CoM heterodisulfide reductase iron-sulfur subunit B family protein [Chloroflexi bacterium]|nr:CoB--CoM heterodisulfide reductase iron-sulfur subunit B family protein [Chloroflexota bacterium]
MKAYAYFPGCSSEASARGLSISVDAIAHALGMELNELADWTCCGSTPYGSQREDEAVLVAARNLAIAEKTGLDLVTPCSNCFVTLSTAQSRLKEHPKLARQVSEALSVVGLSYQGKVRVRHLVEVLYNDISPQAIAEKAQQSFNGLKVAPYYGCQLARPDFGFDHPESPQSLDVLVKALGAEPVPFPLKNRCCGGSMIIPEEDMALGLIRKILDNALANGAQCIVTPCPLCQTNLDAYQSRVNGKFKASYNMPVLFVTQLIGLALDVPPAGLGINMNIVSPARVLAHIKTKQEVKSGT